MSTHGNSRRRYDAGKTMTSRVKIALVIFLIMILLLILKLGYITVVNGQDYRTRAQKRQYADLTIMPERGSIFDSNGKQLAVSVPIYDLWVEIGSFNSIKGGKDTKKAREARYKLANEICSVVKSANKTNIIKKLDQDIPRDLVLKGITLDEKKTLEKNKKLEEEKKQEERVLSLIYFDEKYKRYYPFGTFASYVIGHTTDDARTGLAGVEASMDLELRGTPGKKLYLQDAGGSEISVNDMKFEQVKQGNDVMLTIDEVLQHSLEQILRQAYLTYTPKSVTGLIMQTKTGNVLAMSTIPDYNPNMPRDAAYDFYGDKIKEATTDEEKMKEIYKMWRNPSVNNVFEPGSPFKVITASAALEENKTKMDEYFNDEGSIKVADTTIKNWTPVPYGSISLKKSIEQSVNTTFVKLGQRLGVTTFLDYIDAFGFGKKTNISLPGEEAGVLRNIDKIGPVELANMSFGQGISVTPIQLISAINAIGNEGVLLEPNIVKSINDKEGKIISKTEPNALKQVVSKQTAQQMLMAMEAVVNNGSAKKAQMLGYRIAGKTGSANKVIEGEGGYSKTKFVTDFVAILPVEDPQITVLVVIDEPKEGTQFGSESAVPIGSEIIKSAINYLGIAQNVNTSQNTSQELITVPELKNMSYTDATNTLKNLGLNPMFEKDIVVELESSVVASFPGAGQTAEKGSNIMLYMNSKKDKDMSMPNLIGMTKEQAKVVLDTLELKYDFSGSGLVNSQEPKPGQPISKDFRANINLK